MKAKLLATTTVLALFAALPALAETTPTVGQRLDQSVAASRQVIADTVEKIRDMSADKDSNGAYNVQNVSLKTSAKGMIGQPVYNAKGDEISKVEDILLDKDGNATQIILTNGGFYGMGAKLVAIDFGLVYLRTNNTDVIMPITEESIKKMVPFSHETEDSKTGMHTIPVGSLSTKAMLSGHLLDNSSNQVAAIDNVTLTGGRAAQVIVSYNSTMGMGGEKLSIAYDQLQKVSHDEKVDFKLSDSLTARFKDYTTVNK